jgi:hypothetical protein
MNSRRFIGSPRSSKYCSAAIGRYVCQLLP